MTDREDIAIVGMAGLYPKAPDVDTFWENILNRVDAVTDAPEGWLGKGDIYDPDSDEIRRIYTKRGGFLGDLARFDAKAYGTMPLSISGAQPDQFLALKLAHDALLDAGLEPGKFDGSKTGVILGLAVHANRANTNGIHQFWFNPQTAEMLRALFPEVGAERVEEVVLALQEQLPRITADSIPGLIPNILTGRIANRLDLMGPNYIIDAACASSLITIDLAMNELRSGNADIMLAGGINTTTSPLVYAVFCAVDALDREGRIEPFGREGNGTVLGEGAGIVVLKRLSDALAAGDRIHAVVRGSGQSSDGKSTGLMAPRREGAELAVRRAYENSGIDPETIGLVEAHGTGIALGERIEVDALRAVFGARRGPVPTAAIGSVKSMIGHCIPAAGSASVIKTAMALQSGIIPPTLVGEVNPETGLENTPFYVAEEPRPWMRPGGAPRRAAINAFGFGGINAHLILEEAPQGRERDATAAFMRPVPLAAQREAVFVFAADDRAGVLAALDAFAAPEGDFVDAALATWAAAKGPARLSIVATDAADLAKKVKAAQKGLAKPETTSLRTRNGIYFEATPLEGRIAFLFPGEMAQYTDMLKDAALALPLVRDWLADISALTETRREVRLQDVVYPPDNLISDETRSALDGLMHQVDYGSEMVFAADQAIYETLRAMGVVPDAMLGHSTGENAALVASGKLALDRAGVCRMIDDMNRVFDEVDESGSVPNGVLLTVAALDTARLEEIQADFPDIHLTMDNCPNQAILFGEAERIDALQSRVVAEGAVCTRLPISWGYHTEYVRPMAEGFRALFEGIEMRESPVTLYSCTTAAPFPEDREGALETAVSQYVSPVRFTDALRRLHDDGHRIFIECGPNANLTAFVRDSLGERPHLAISADNKRRGLLGQLTHLAAQLFVAGRDVSAVPLFAPPEGPDAAQRRALRAAHLAAPPLPSNLVVQSFTPEMAAEMRAELFEGHGAAPLSERPPAPDSAATAGAPPVGAAHEPSPAAVPARPAAPEETSHAMRDHMATMSAFLSGQDRVMRQILMPGVEPPRDARQIHCVDVAGYFDLPFAFQAYLMQGSPSPEALAPYLGVREQDEAAALAGSAGNRWLEWSLSRLAVKRAAADILAATGGHRPDAQTLEVLKDANGAPYLDGCAAHPPPGISIAHAGAVGFGAAAAPGWQVGIDYELPDRISDPEGFLGAILGPEEHAQIPAAADQNTATALWSIKEAAAKALGQGLQGRPQSFRITALDPASGSAVIAHDGQQVAAHLRQIGEGICSVAYVAAGQAGARSAPSLPHRQNGAATDARIGLS